MSKKHTKEITLIRFAEIEAVKEGVTPRTIKNRIARGDYPHLKMRRLNRRVTKVEYEKEN
jgi:hypothetical protein